MQSSCSSFHPFFSRVLLYSHVVGISYWLASSFPLEDWLSPLHTSPIQLYFLISLDESLIPVPTSLHCLSKLDIFLIIPKHRTKSTRTVDHFNLLLIEEVNRRKMDEYFIETCLQTVEHINNMLDHNNTEHQRSIESAKSVMSSLDDACFFDDTTQLEAQTKVIETLQRLAFVNIDVGAIDDIADWCLQKWLVMLQLHPQTIHALKGSVNMTHFIRLLAALIIQASVNGGYPKPSLLSRASMQKKAVRLRVAPAQQDGQTVILPTLRALKKSDARTERHKTKMQRRDFTQKNMLKQEAFSCQRSNT